MYEGCRRGVVCRRQGTAKKRPSSWREHTFKNNGKQVDTGRGIVPVVASYRTRTGYDGYQTFFCPSRCRCIDSSLENNIETATNSEILLLHKWRRMKPPRKNYTRVYSVHQKYHVSSGKNAGRQDGDETPYRN